MGTGYTRNDTGNNIADGNVINASDLDGEFDAVESAFNGSTGHSHDGTTGEGPQIDTTGIADDAVTGDKIDSTTTVTAASFVGPVTGNVTGNLTGDVTGNADTATALETSRTISLTGDVTGSASFDGSANASITATIADDSHNHVVGNIDGIAEYIQDTAGAMFSGNTENGITVTYQDADGTIDLDVNDPTITLTGDVSGSATMTNLGNVSITATVADDSHNHVISNVDGLQTALDGKQATLGTGDVTSAMIAGDAITGAKIADNSINSEHYVDGSIDAVHLASDSVTAAKIAAGAVGSSELASSGVTAGSYGSASAIPTLTIDVDGRITAASTASVSVPANCSNCSSYTNLTNKPTIPSNCSNCSGDVNAGSTSYYGYSSRNCVYDQQCNNCPNCSYQCAQCTQCFAYGSGKWGQFYNCEINKSGTALRNAGKPTGYRYNCPDCG